MTNEQRTRCHAIIHTAAIAAGGGNALPVPGLGVAADTAALAGMAIGLAGVFGKSLPESVAKTMALIRSSYQAIKAVAVRVAGIALSGVAKRLAGTASSAVIAAASDGPLPIGDVVGTVIAVVGLGWTAYDIYKVCKTMPAEMRSGIQGSIDEVRGKLRQTALENLQADCDKCRSSADARMQELNAMLEQ